MKNWSLYECAKKINLFSIINMCLWAFMALGIGLIFVQEIVGAILSSLASLTFLTLNIISSILILIKDWKKEELNQSKILWGILTIVILGPIASFVFSRKALAGLTPDMQGQSAQLVENINKIEKIKALYNEGLLTQEEAAQKIKDQMKEMEG